MKRFLFEQEQILRLRRQQRDAAEAQLRKLADEMQRLEVAKQACGEDLSSLSARIETKPGNGLSVLESISQQLTLLDVMRDELSELETKHAEARQRLNRSNANVEAVELLKTEKQAIHRRLDQKREQEAREYRSLMTWQIDSQTNTKRARERTND